MPKNPLWVEELQKRDKESAKQLNKMLLEIARHKGVFSLSGDPAIAQLWFAMIELSRKHDDLKKALEELRSGKAPKIAEIARERKRSEILEALENY